MGRIPQHIIDDILNTARIEEVIGEYVNLKRAGSNLKGLSPFTDEKSPSFMVSPAKQIFKCFSSGKGGTVISFLMEQEQFSYPEALKWLAQRYNIELPEEKPLTVEEQQQISERESLGIINDFARDFFVDRMHNGEEGKSIGLSYFVERGFRKDTIEKFQLGYCPRVEGSFTETALKKGYKLNYLEQLGLSKTKNDRSFDFFSGRVMFPIHSVSGKVLGFGGRTLQSDNKKVAKYFNSPESIIYNKSKVLYGIYFAKADIIKYDNCFLVEGYTDVISLSQSGVTNVVSSSGTALTKDQIKLIKRYTNNVTILYDGDAAGIRASFRGIDLILEEGLNVKVVLFPDNEDPDSYAKKVGSTELKTYLETAQKDFVSFKADILLEDTENDPIKKAALIRNLATSIALIPDTITRSVYVQSTSKKLEVAEQVLLQEINTLRRKQISKDLNSGQNNDFEDLSDLQEGIKQNPVQQISKEQGKRNFEPQENDVIRILVKYGSRAIEILQRDEMQKVSSVEISVSELIVFELERDGITFENAIYQEIYDIVKSGLEENILYDPTYFLRMENQDIVQFTTNLLSPKHELSDLWLMKFNIDTSEEIHKLGQAVKETVYVLKNVKINRRIEEIQESLKSESNDDVQETEEELLTELMELQLIKRTFALALGRIII